jgi:hypothetical protein
LVWYGKCEQSTIIATVVLLNKKKLQM